MKYPKYILLLLLLTSTVSYVQAQSTNFSQYQVTPFYTSPGELATTDYFQLLGHYRKQSLDQEQGIESFALSGIYPLYLNEGGRRFGGIGLGVMNEKAGALGMLNQMSLKAGYAYNWQVNRLHHVSVGLQGGYYRRSLDLSAIRTDYQYQDGLYRPNLPTGENFANAVSQTFMADAGVSWYGLDAYGDQQFSLGFSAFNVNRASYRYLTYTEEQAMPIRYQVHGSIRAFSTESLQLLPTFRYMKEKNYDQLNVGALLQYKLGSESSSMHESHLGFGAWYSLDNAAIFSLSLVKPAYLMSFSYDLPASANISEGRVNNAVELTFGWRLHKGKNRKQLVANRGQLSADVQDAKPTKEESAPEEVLPAEEIPVSDPEKEEVEEPEAVELTMPEERVETEEVAIQLKPEEVEILETKPAFDLGSTALSVAARQELSRVAEVLKANPALRIRIIGHACTLGEEKLNQQISLKRARVAKDELMGTGIEEDRIRVEGKGFHAPIAPNNTEAGRKQNRRVEFVIEE